MSTPLPDILEGLYKDLNEMITTDPIINRFKSTFSPEGVKTGVTKTKMGQLPVPVAQKMAVEKRLGFLSKHGVNTQSTADLIQRSHELISGGTSQKALHAFFAHPALSGEDNVFGAKSTGTVGDQVKSRVTELLKAGSGHTMDSARKQATKEIHGSSRSHLGTLVNNFVSSMPKDDTGKPLERIVGTGQPEAETKHLAARTKLATHLTRLQRVIGTVKTLTDPKSGAVQPDGTFDQTVIDPAKGKREAIEVSNAGIEAQVKAKKSEAAAAAAAQAAQADTASLENDPTFQRAREYGKKRSMGVSAGVADAQKLRGDTTPNTFEKARRFAQEWNAGLKAGRAAKS